MTYPGYARNFVYIVRMLKNPLHQTLHCNPGILALTSVSTREPYVNSFDKMSEQRRTYTKKDANPCDVRTAGVPGVSRSEAPTFYVKESLNKHKEGKEGAVVA